MIALKLGEKGQAMAEFVVTLPVYLLIFFGVIYFGEMGVLNQRVNKAARYMAWNDVSCQATNDVSCQATNDVSCQATIKEKFFSGFEGELKVSLKNVTPFGEEGLKDQGVVDLVSELFSWGMGAKRATVTYKHPTPIFDNLPSVTLEATHLVAGRENIVERFWYFIRRLFYGEGKKFPGKEKLEELICGERDFPQ